MKVDKSKFKDEKGRYIVQGLFLEDRYNTDLAVYTLAGEDKDYKGQLFPSLKRLYLECGDPEEYTFATTYLYDWPHWQRLCKNSIVGKEIDTWREELILSLRSEALESVITQAMDGSFQAAKFVIEEGWNKRKRGRPSKEEVNEKLARDAKLSEEFDEHITLLKEYKGKNV